MRWIGICERSFDLMCRRAASREFAPGKPLGTQQIIQQWIADSRAEINAARLMVLEAAWKIDNQGMNQAREEISCIKFFAADVLLKVIDRAIQVHGRWESPAIRRCRRSCATSAAREFTTAPTKSTRWSSPNACCPATG